MNEGARKIRSRRMAARQPCGKRQRRGVSRGQSLLLCGLFGCAVLLAAAVALKQEFSRLLKPNVAAAARAYLVEKNVRPLPADLQTALRDAAGEAQASHMHPLLNQSAPDFVLHDELGLPHSLASLREEGCVVLVFYYGYHCNHCVGQLFAVQDDIRRFEALGARVAAISGDPPAETRKRFAEYGKFAFPVLSDPGNLTALRYGVFEPAVGEQRERQQHGTFLIDRAGIVRWCNYGDEPFIDNRTLLYEIHRASTTAAAAPLGGQSARSRGRATANR